MSDRVYLDSKAARRLERLAARLDVLPAALGERVVDRGLAFFEELYRGTMDPQKRLQRTWVRHIEECKQCGTGRACMQGCILADEAILAGVPVADLLLERWPIVGVA